MELSLGTHPEDDPLRSTYKQIEGFEEHPTWWDICQWVNETERELKDDLVKVDSVEEIKELQGKIKILKLITELPDLFKKQIEADLMQTENEEEI